MLWSFTLPLIHCKTAESVIFHPVEHIHTSISSWILTTAIDFQPYKDALLNVQDYALDAKKSLTDKVNTFHRNDPRYLKLFNMTLNDFDNMISELKQTHVEATNLIGHIHNNRITKRSLLPLGGLFSFLFGTGDQKEIDQLKANVQELYENQMAQTDVLNDVITVANISRGLINENILKINQIIDTISAINETIDFVLESLKPLYAARRFLFLHSEFIHHHSRVRYLMRQLHKDMRVIKQYLSVHSTGKLNAEIIDPTHLKIELIKIQKLLPDRLSLPEDPNKNIWHYYKFLTATPLSQGNKLILMIKVPLIDLDSSMTLYKVYNLPIFHQTLGKSLLYNIEGNNLAVTRDNKYMVVLTESEFIQCTLAEGHFCTINSALYHIETSKSCLSALFIKDNTKINKYCTLDMTNITGPKAIYLDQGLWAISLDKIIHMEIQCTAHTKVQTLRPPISFVKLQPTCSAFSSDIKLPPYFKQFSSGFAMALKSANLNVPKFEPTNFRIWQPFNVSKIPDTSIPNLQRLEPASNVPISQLKMKVAQYKLLSSKEKVPWKYYLGGGTGSLVIVVIIIVSIVIWRYKFFQRKDPRPPMTITYSAPESQNMLHTREGVIGSDQFSVPGRKAVRFQEPESNSNLDMGFDRQYALASALLDQLEDLGADVTRHRRRLRNRQLKAVP